MHILFLEKVFLKPKTQPARGVELFNLNLLRDLAGLGIEVTVPAHRSWADDVKGAAGDGQVIACSLGRTPLLNGIQAALRVARRRFDVVLLANVANGLIPALRLLGTRPAARWVLIAHREPSARFVRACRALPMTVVAVNHKIAGHFDGDAFERVDVWYGITEADRFYPRDGEAESGAPFKCCVLGQLDNAWKGADMAVEAFRRLPEPVRDGCELHLASFENPPSYPEENIRAYPWMSAGEVPEFLRWMDAMLVPSRDEGVMRETFSQAIVQGMLTGLPVCASDLPILTEKLDAGGGIVCGNADELADAIQRLAADPALRRELGEQGRTTALARYVWKTQDFVTRYLPSANPS